MKIKTSLTILLFLTLGLMILGYIFYAGKINVGEQLNYSKKKPVEIVEQTPASSTEEILQREAQESEQRRTEIMDSLKAQMASDTPVEDPKVVEKKIDTMKKMLLK